jgi:hypothetical protein
VLLNDSALATLHGAASAIDRTASSYWRREADAFSVDPSGAVRGGTVLGMIARPRGRWYSALHRLLQTPFALIGRRFAAFAECRSHGRLIAERQAREFTEDILRQVLVLSLVRGHVATLPASQAIAVIGDGFGVLSSLLRLSFPQHNILVVNLTRPLLLDLVSIRKVFPSADIALLEPGDDVAGACRQTNSAFFGVRADDADLMAAAPIGLALNVESMQEMDPPVIAAYFDRLRRCPAPTTYFYCCNRREKTLYDGTVVRFADYPFAAGDRILVDGACPWLRMSYGTRPPFYTFRPAGTFLHRLVALAKTA